MTTTVSQQANSPPATAIVEELSPHLNPWDVLQRLAPLRHAVLFDSAAAHAPLGRYSFISADPFDWLQSHAHTMRGDLDTTTGNPLLLLAERLQRWCTETLPDLPPFQGGAAGLFGYDLCHHLERLPRPRFDDFATPDLAVGFYDWVLAFDHERQGSWLISTGFPEMDPRRRRLRAERRLRAVKRLLREPPRPIIQPASAPRPPRAPQYPIPGHPGVTSNFDRTRYLTAARRAIEYIHAGDCFQVNLSQRLLTPARLPALELYHRLRQRNPAPFASYFDLGDFTILSASPERFLRVRDGVVEARPIKGTRPRGQTTEEDNLHAHELLNSVKDRAENIMIVDLLRNDLGRVCTFGSVQVPVVCTLETYRYVHHLVSEVRGRLRPGLGPVDLLSAAFPGGSVTGAPKIRAMEIIAELEPSARGPYCGSLGYLGFDGSMDTSILIRTFTQGRGWLQFPVGGGIVADSTAEVEYEETWHKAEGLLRALA